MKVCLKEEYEICRDEHILTRVLPVYYSALRQEALLGLDFDNPLSLPPWMSDADEYVKKCLTFEFVLNSSVQYSRPDEGLSMSETVSARVPMQYTTTAMFVGDQLPPAANANLGLVTGSPTPFTASGYSVRDDSPCDEIGAATGKNGQLGVSFLSFTPGVDGTSVQDFGVSLALVPNLSTYDYTWKYEGENGCEEQIGSGSELLSWSTSLGAALLGKYTVGDDGAYVTGWSVTGGDVLANKDIAFSENDGTESFQRPVNMVLFHKPVK